MRKTNFLTHNLYCKPIPRCDRMMHCFTQRIEGRMPIWVSPEGSCFWADFPLSYGSASLSSHAPSA